MITQDWCAGSIRMLYSRSNERYTLDERLARATVSELPAKRRDGNRRGDQKTTALATQHQTSAMKELPRGTTECRATSLRLPRGAPLLGRGPCLAT
jgi:hypothetical protein